MQKEDNVHWVVCYVDEAGETTLRCPQCGITKAIDTKNKNYAFKAFKAKCRCGAQIKGQFEFRRYYRKNVNLSGSYRDRRTGVQGKVVIENLSLMGIGFNCLRKHNFKAGDELDIIFTLDNVKQSKVTLWVVVTYVRDRFIGAKRQDPTVEKPDLGFYLK